MSAMVRGALTAILSMSLAMLPGAVLGGTAPAATPKLYWTNSGTDTIGAANLDGTAVKQTVVTGDPNPTGVAVDGRHVYWTNTPANAIGEANLDGTGAAPALIQGGNQPKGVAVDAKHVYWANEGDGTIGRANLDGTAVEERFITGAVHPVAVTVDAGHVYWTDVGSGSIGRASLDGSAVDPGRRSLGAPRSPTRWRSRPRRRRSRRPARASASPCSPSASAASPSSRARRSGARCAGRSGCTPSSRPSPASAPAYGTSPFRRSRPDRDARRSGARDGRVLDRQRAAGPRLVLGPRRRPAQLRRHLRGPRHPGHGRGQLGAANSGRNLYIADYGDEVIRKVGPDGTISRIAGSAAPCATDGFTPAGCGDGGPALAASLDGPAGVAVDSRNLYIADYYHDVIRRVASDQTISTVAGDGESCTDALSGCGDGGPATAATLYNPQGVAVGSAGELYIADTLANAIRKVMPDGNIRRWPDSPGGTISLVVGTGPCVHRPAARPASPRRTLHGPRSVAVDAAGDLFIADTGDNEVRVVR